MTHPCNSHRMTCTTLVNDSEDCIDICPCCSLGARTASHGGQESGVYGWCTCKVNQLGLYIQGLPAKTKPQDRKASVNPTPRRQYNKPPEPESLSLPFIHHDDPRRYIKDYTKFESYTMGQDTNYMVQYEYAGQSAKLLSRWEERFGDRDQIKPGLSYQHGTAAKVPNKYQYQTIQESNDIDQSNKQDYPIEVSLGNELELGEFDGTTSRDYYMKNKVPDLTPGRPQKAPASFRNSYIDSIYPSKEAPNFFLQGTGKNSPEVTSGKQSNSRSENRLVKGKRLIPKTHSISQDQNNQTRVKHTHYNSLEEYYAKQIEEDFFETMAQYAHAGQFQKQGLDIEDFAIERISLEQSIQGLTNTRDKPVRYEEIPSEDVTQENTNSSRFDSTPRYPQTIVLPSVNDNYDEEESPRRLRLPPLVENTSSLDLLNDYKNRSQKGGVGRRLSNPLTVSLPSVHTDEDNQSSENYANKKTRKTLTMHHSQPVLGERTFPRYLHGVPIVLPKLHKWLSDGAVDRNTWATEQPKPQSSASVYQSKPQTQTFSKEFLEYASQVKDKEAVKALYDVHNSRRSAELPENDAVSLPDEPDTNNNPVLSEHPTSSSAPPNTPAAGSRLYLPQPQAIKSPNTPPAGSRLYLPQPQAFKSKHKPSQSNKPLKKKTESKTPRNGVRVPMVNLNPDLNITTERLNENVVEKVDDLFVSPRSNKSKTKKLTYH